MNSDDVRELARGCTPEIRVQAEIAAQIANFNEMFLELLELLKREMSANE